ncbi:unnamed protein product [Schistosoma mattheei]|uniref:Uncharacterized protein n=1 Tax=Schistosoma mattheei TaxID=31246 RepID=A0A183PEK5_9TREM|nr:unnamed protein product [Schistosoma mattheei]
MEDNLKGIKEALTPTCQEVLGREKHQRKEWIFMETLDKIQQRKNKTAINESRTGTKKVKAYAEYTIANKQVKRSIGADKQKYVGHLPNAAREENM